MITNCLLLLVYLSLIVIRQPSLMMGRFWAEEGTVYFSYAYSMPWYKTIIMSHLGYYSLVDNIAALLAFYLVSLEQAPKVTVIFALIIQLIPALLIIISHSDPFRGYTRKFFAILIILVAVPSQEVWLNTINSQFYLTLCVGIIMVSQFEGKFTCWFYRLILLISGLTGPVAVFLTPLFWIVSGLQRSRERVIQASILTCCALIQFLLMINALTLGERTTNFNLKIFLSATFIKCVTLPLTGIKFADWVARYPRSVYLNELLSIILMTFILLFIYFFLKGIWSSQVFEAKLLAAGSIIVLTLSYFGALNLDRLGLISAIGDGCRYYYVPNAMISLSILCSLSSDSLMKSVTKNIFKIVLAWLIIVGSIQYFSTYKTQLFFMGPDWAGEVRKWRENPNYQLGIWPVNWRMTLPK